METYFGFSRVLNFFVSGVLIMDSFGHLLIGISFLPLHQNSDDSLERWLGERWPLRDLQDC